MKTIFAAALVASVLAVPAFAAEEYPSGPAFAPIARVPSVDVGSVRMPQFNGQTAASSTQLRMMPTAGAEGSVESVASQTVALGTREASIGLLP